MSIDKIGFAQMILFGFPFGERTLIKGESFSGALPNHLQYLVSPLSYGEKGMSSILSSTLKECISEQLNGLKYPAIFMSAGYDSRLILAGMLSSGAKPNLVTYHNRSTSSELEIVARIAREFNLIFSPCEDIEISKDIFDESLSRYLQQSLFLSNPVRLMYFIQTIDANIKADGIFSGEGETFRLPGYPSEYLTLGAFAVLKGENVSLPRNCLFHDLPWEQAILEVRRNTSNWDCGLGTMGKVHRWLTEQAYPKIYGSMAMAFGSIAPVYLPLMKPRFIREIAMSKYSISNRQKMESSIMDLWRSKYIYNDIISDLYQDLLNIPTDRGYSPKNDKNIFQYFCYNSRRRIRNINSGEKQSFSASKGALSYKQMLYERLDTKASLLPFVDNGKINRIVKAKADLSGDVIHSLSQVLILSEMFQAGHL